MDTHRSLCPGIVDPALWHQVLEMTTVISEPDYSFRLNSITAEKTPDQARVQVPAVNRVMRLGFQQMACSLSTTPLPSGAQTCPNAANAALLRSFSQVV